MSTMVVGIGNTLRGDDGVGPFVIDLLRAARVGWLELRTAPALLPEFAVELPGYEAVVFVDADVKAREVTLQPVAMEASDPLHGVTPTRVVQLARGLGFDGEAWICSVPVQSMDPRVGLSRQAVLASGHAVALLLGVQRRPAEDSSLPR